MDDRMSVQRSTEVYTTTLSKWLVLGGAACMLLFLWVQANQKPDVNKYLQVVMPEFSWGGCLLLVGIMIAGLYSGLAPVVRFEGQQLYLRKAIPYCYKKIPMSFVSGYSLSEWQAAITVHCLEDGGEQQHTYFLYFPMLGQEEGGKLRMLLERFFGESLSSARGGESSS
ncbi:hypothetical protein KUV86_08545 [Halomonas sp. DP8Y7-3]|uniref:hypothetical protein n=1 Tax=Halomonas sp. DP8Y7-3 TaxID=2859079 RepID=UPI001C96BA42|nr:hypothetical protein [Halomonas sp. DP8Y7-3]MBY5929159.1 hypothetical protein [Halomonas sp. DP8Y7-3]